MERTGYFNERIRKRGIPFSWVEEALQNEVEREVQPNGRIRVWGWVEERRLYFRVILLEDGKTLLNAFPDSSFTRKRGAP